MEAMAGAGSHRILLRWLIGLRWVLVGILAATLPLGESVMGFHVRWEVAVPAVVALGAFNLWVQRRLAARGDASMRFVLVTAIIDLAGIAVVLAASGGAANPLSALFFVHVALAASLLPALPTFGLLALATAMFGSLFLLPSGACCPSHPSHGAFSNHLYGMLLAFALSGAVVAWFLTRVRLALEAGERQIAALRQRSEDEARFAALGTLAAGTAHELATPLGTIAVLAGELGEARDVAEVRRQAATIGAQVARCRDVIGKMQAAGRETGKVGAGTPLAPAVVRAVDDWRLAHPGVVVEVAASEAPASAVPLTADDVEMAVRALLDNACHAMSGRMGTIVVTLGAEGGAPFVRVDDEGSGVPEALRGRLGEPFLTTKEPGEGMGLGLYLVRKLLEVAGGGLEVRERAPAGTSVLLRFGTAGLA
jgi:two-component system sensor histidine kinase RegB